LEVEVNEKNLQKIIGTYKAAYKDIVGEIAGATDWGVQNRKKILKQIEVILSELGENTNDWIKQEIPEYYELGADDAVKQLKNVRAPVAVETGFNQIHKDAIAALVDETAKAFAEGLVGVDRNAQLLLGRFSREALTQKMASGMVSGAALRNVKREMKGRLMEDGLAAIVDRGGRSWTLDRYSEMLFRTKVVETRNRGIANRLVENGYDLVQVSNHGKSSCPLCLPWQGKVLSSTGATRGYDTVIDAERAGLFHPNCRHAINVLVPKIAKMTRAYDPEKGAYDPAGESMRGPIKEQVKKNMTDPAKKHQEKFKQNFEKISKKLNVDHHIGSPKKLERSTNKVINDYNAETFELKDTNRGAVIIRNPWDKKEFDAIVESVSEHYEIHRVKEKLHEETGYAMNMVNIKLPGGRIGEVQVTYEEMWTAKTELGGDKLYDVVRVKGPEWRKAEKQMLKLYSEARDAALDRTGVGKP
jgi:hypothetical protein